VLSDEIHQAIKSSFPDAAINLDGEDCSFQVTVISDGFDGLSVVNRQQQVLATVHDKLTSGEIHALSVSAFTLAEWEVKYSQHLVSIKM
jgi:acid stress-induced BolA-like protein IbaG/YrbA